MKVAVVLLFIAFGARFVNPANWHPFIPPERRRTGHASAFARHHPRRARVVFFAYIGFDAVSTAAQEAKNPQRDCRSASSARWSSAPSSTSSVSLVLTGVVNYKQLDVPAPGRACGVDGDRPAAGSADVRRARRHRRPRRR